MISKNFLLSKLFRSKWGVIGIILLATLLRLTLLEWQSIAFDESFSLVVGSANWSLLFQAILSDGVHPPLFYVLHKLALAIWGNTEFGQRFMVAVFSLLGLPLIYQLGKRLFNAPTGLFAMLLLALNPLHIWFAQEARMYSLLSLLATLSALFFWEALYRNTVGSWLKLALTNGLIFLTHYFGLLIPVVQFGYLIFTFGHNYKRLRPWFLSQLGAGILLIPWLIATWLRPVQSFGIGFLVQPTLMDLPLTFWNLTTGISVFSGLAGLTLVCFGLALGALFYFRSPLTRRTLRRPYLLLLSWSILPPLLIWLLSQKRPFYADRYLSFCIPALLLLVSVGVTQVPYRLIRNIGSVGLILVTLFGLVNVLQSMAYQKDNWRETAAYVTNHQQRGDIVLLRSLHIKFAFDYYYQGHAETVPVSVNLKEFDIDSLVDGASRVWLIFPYTRKPTHYPMQPLTDESVWDLELDQPILLKRWFIAHEANILDNQRFLGVQVWLINLKS